MSVSTDELGWNAECIQSALPCAEQQLLTNARHQLRSITRMVFGRDRGIKKNRLMRTAKEMAF